MQPKHLLLLIVGFATLFTFLFYKNTVGINLLIYEMGVLLALYFTNTLQVKTVNQKTITGLFILTAIATVIVHSTYSYWMNVLCFLSLIGIAFYPSVVAIATTYYISLSNILFAQIGFFKLFNTVIFKSNSGKRIINWRLSIYIIPIIIIGIFLFIYSESNPIFNNLLGNISTKLTEWIGDFFAEVNFLLFFMFLLGIVVSNIIFIKAIRSKVEDRDATQSLDLIRKRKKLFWLRKPMRLKYEYLAGVFLLAALNGILLIVNVIDINWVWFNFNWEGEYLKQFVHNGTYLLIVSILISMALVLYFFRANLNFYSNNKWLKYLSYAWLAQNAILVISVCIRNVIYVQYFALAYKRIGVFIFLVLTLYGLYSVFVKVSKQKTFFYLLKVNSYVVIVLLSLTSLVNWDVLIARYNFANAHKSYLHLNFMAQLSNTALPYIDKPLDEVNKIKQNQDEAFYDFEYESSRGYSSLYLTPEQYVERVKFNKERFKENWQAKNWLEWNWAEYNAYQNLK